MPYRNLKAVTTTDKERAASPSVLGLGSEKDRIWVALESGPEKAAITEAILLFTMNPKPFDSTRGNREEWLCAPATTISEGRVEATMPRRVRPTLPSACGTPTGFSSPPAAQPLPDRAALLARAGRPLRCFLQHRCVNPPLYRCHHVSFLLHLPCPHRHSGRIHVLDIVTTRKAAPLACSSVLDLLADQSPPERYACVVAFGREKRDVYDGRIERKMHMMKIPTGICIWTCLCGTLAVFAQETPETLPPLVDGKAPQTFEELWAGFDPQTEPLEVEVLHEWEEDGVVLKILRYRIGVFKGQKAIMAAVYGYPKGGTNLPGLVQIHGGGQYADQQAVLTNAKRGYATISISWAGRITATDYRVTPNEVKLFWENKTEDPRYKLTTDWGALDAYHAPSRHGKDAFASLPVEEWTLDPVESPRNNSWFLCTLGGRRALTFLEQQPEVDGERLGTYGHSMGGKLTVLLAGVDARVKAAAPSCGGISDRYNDKLLHRNTVGDGPSLERIACPTIFLSPANDFHGHINDLIAATAALGEETPWRVTCSAHMAHKDLPEFEVATQLWFDEHLKGSFAWPDTPTTDLRLASAAGVPVFSVTPDRSRPVLEVDVFYTQQGVEGGDRALRENRINRFWHHAVATENAGVWTASLPVSTSDKPLWVYANVLYPLDEAITGAGYYYGKYTTDRFNLSSLLQIARPAELEAAGVEATLQQTPVIEAFADGWKKEWFTDKPNGWPRSTHKVYDPVWAAPKGATLALDVRSAEPNKLVIGIDKHAAEVTLAGGPDWQAVTVAVSAFKNVAGVARDGWEGIKELRLAAMEKLKEKQADGKEATTTVGAPWQGAPPEFRNLRWVAPPTS